MGNSHRDFHDNRIGSPANEMSKLTRICFCPLSQCVDELWRHWIKVALISNDPRAGHCLLSLSLIERLTGTLLSVKLRGPVSVIRYRTILRLKRLTNWVNWSIVV